MAIATTESIRANLDRKLAHIRNRKDLNGQARQVAVARAYQDAEQKMEQVRQADADRYRHDRTRLERQLFGGEDAFGSDAMNQRQAREMAAQLTDPHAAADAYQRAVRDGDKAYARAIASHAADLATVPLFGAAWGRVVQQYTQGSSARAEAYEQLTTMREPGTGTDFSYVLPSPSELGRLSAGQVVALADSDLTVWGDEPGDTAA
ncbi:hypothetical protein ACIQVR_21625 [Streptomyces xanthochromogenes]|uniref:hypothetical protein n=1 Tax=Streptomyces xanthochromogenes TaxID=67384 RepID=UPI00382E2F6D